MKHWLLIDVNYLAHRAFYSTGTLSHNEVPTGVTYGVLAETLRVMDNFATSHVCFCFDHGKPLRQKLLKAYKSSRTKKKRDMDDEQKKAYQAMLKQVDNLRLKLLPYLGFRNVFSEKGFEADDVIASLAQSIPAPHHCIIVSNDSDLYQLITSRCYVWSPHKKQVMNLERFREQYGIEPSQWADVKAIAGDATDDVPGVPGVGEKTAIRYLRGDLKPGALMNKIVKQNRWKENLPLVSLPFEGCPTFELSWDELDIRRWRKAMKKYGFTTLMGSMPQ